MKTGICKECGQEKKIKARGMCVSCYRKALKMARKRCQTPTVVLTFEGHEALFEELKQLAQREFRPLDWQILQILKSHMQGPDDIPTPSTVHL